MPGGRWPSGIGAVTVRRQWTRMDSLDCPIPTVTVWKLGCLVLTWTMECRHQVGLDSYDRLFPNQDTRPKGGLGTLIALPLQRIPRKTTASSSMPRVDHILINGHSYRCRRGCRPRLLGELVSEDQCNGDLIRVRISRDEDGDAGDPWNLPPSGKQREQPIEGLIPEVVPLVRALMVVWGPARRADRFVWFTCPESAVNGTTTHSSLSQGIGAN